MRKLLIVLVVIAGVIGLPLVIGFMTYISTYNSLVKERNEVNQTWAQVENVYQRRADLIPNLVEVVKGYATHEKEVFTQVTEARARVGSVNISNLSTDVEAQKDFAAAQQNLGSALSRLIAVSESYPTLKANENFLTLQSQLEGTENRIAVERRNSQLAVETYNTHLQGFFTSIFFGNKKGFEAVPYFKAQAGSEKAPTVKF